MPKATVATELHRLDLKSCPGGFVSVRKHTFGELLKRRGMMGTLQRSSSDPDDAEMAIRFDAAAFYSFSKTIMEHNLENGDGQLLNFRDRSTMEKLDPKIGLEIEEFVSSLNEGESEEDLAPLSELSTKVSTTEKSKTISENSQ